MSKFLVMFLIGLASSLVLQPGQANFTSFQAANPPLLLDAFAGTAGTALASRTPPIGPVWQTTGGAGPNLVAGAGVMFQNGDNGQSGYAFNVYSSGILPRKAVTTWSTVENPITVPPTIGYATSFNFAAINFIHGQQTPTNFFIQVGASGPTFTNPVLAVLAAPYTMSPNVVYTTEWHYNGTDMVAMVFKDANGNRLGAEYTWDPNYALSNTGQILWFETFVSPGINYTLCETFGVTNYPFPTLNILQQTTFPTNAAGWVGDPSLGGTVTWNSAGSLTIAGNGGDAGGDSPTLSALNINDVIVFTMDITAQTGSWAVSVLDPIVGGPITGIQSVAGGTGRQSFSFTMTSAGTVPYVIVASTATSSSITLASSYIIKNPPTTPP